jgi:hypothetical protein
MITSVGWKGRTCTNIIPLDLTNNVHRMNECKANASDRIEFVFGEESVYLQTENIEQENG